MEDAITLHHMGAHQERISVGLIIPLGAYFGQSAHKTEVNVSSTIHDSHQGNSRTYPLSTRRLK
jgi:hypothetical protein